MAPATAQHGRDRLRGVHYFGAHDPISFLDGFEPDQLAADLAQIRADGFDTVFLLLPWHALFPQADSDTLDPWYAGRLRLLLRAAAGAGLKVRGRLFYAHSPTVTPEAWRHDRPLALLRQPQQASDQLGRQALALARCVADSPAWHSAFVTWEDFWPCFDAPAHWDAQARLAIARSSGFSDWITNHWAPEASANGLTCTDGCWSVPVHQSPGMRLWLKFFDHLLRTRILAPCQTAFPSVGIEVRVDAYPIRQPDTPDWDWAFFDLFDDCPGQRYLYWGPFYGMPNQGERIDAATARNGLRLLLQRFEGASKPVLDQFNFSDETLNFASHHARIQPAEIPTFVAESSELFQRQTSGYALWAYRDYRENWLENPSFQRRHAGWQGELDWPADAPGVLVAPGGTLAQDFNPEMRAHVAQTSYGDFCCEVRCDSTALRLQVAGQWLPAQVSRPGWLSFQIPHAAVAWTACAITLTNPQPQPVQVLCVYFFGFVQRLQVRNEHGEPGPYLAAVQALNQRLQARAPQRSTDRHKPWG